MSDFRRRGLRLPPTQSEREAVDLLYEWLTDGAYKNGARFTEPDDDWTPVWLVLTPAGHATLFTGNEHKHAITRRVGAFAQRAGAIAIGHVHSAWGVFQEDVGYERIMAIDRQMQAQGGSTEGIPERREMLHLAIYTATLSHIWRCLITRHEDGPPTLGRFEDQTGEPPRGKMATPLMEALKRRG